MPSPSGPRSPRAAAVETSAWCPVDDDVEFPTFTGGRLPPSVLAGPLTGAHFADVLVTEVDVPEFLSARSSWRTVEVRGCRIGAAEWYDTQWRSVLVAGSRLGFVNARGANWQDVLFRDCIVDELDLGGASISRLRFERCTVRTLDVHRARLADVDLRGTEFQAVRGPAGLAGSWISDQQLVDLAPLLAAELKINLG